MKALVAYDSNFGNTQKIAEIIAEILGGKAVSVKSFKKEDLTGTDLFVLGSPIIGWKPTINTMSFLGTLDRRSLKSLKFTTFDTRVKLFIHGDAMEKMASRMGRTGAKLIVQPEAFYVAGPQNAPYLLDGEMERVVKWAEEISNSF